MFFKLAINNIKKSYKDYLIYFLTITFGICLFYLFNSMESQKAMMVLDPTKSEVLAMMSGALNYVSFFMTVVLAFLMVYANQFLIKRRKKEMGIYMTLGMERLKISYILVLETLLIGIISLIVGILLGILGSHFLSIITARLFRVDMKAFRFIFSKSAFTKAILNFSVIYGIMIILNVFNVSRVKLIDLLYASRKNQDVKLKKVWLTITIFITSLVVLAYAYYCIMENGMMNFDMQFKQAIIFGLIGTLLFFMSLSEILLDLFKLNKRHYYRNLNMFSLRQISSKVNTTYMMISVLCILLLIAIGTFSTGMGIVSVVNETQDESLPFDVSLQQWMDVETVSLLESNPKLSALGAYSNITFYENDMKESDLIDISQYQGNLSQEVLEAYHVEFMTLSDYNTHAALLSSPLLELDQEYVVITNIDDFYDLYDHLPNLTIEGKQYHYLKTRKETLRNEFKLSTIAIIVVPDNAVAGMDRASEVVNYPHVNLETQELSKKLNDMRAKNGFFMVNIREEIIASSLGMRTVIAYIALYIGLVFIMSSVVCLALQQLTEANDNVERYNLLRKLGVENAMIKHSLLTQIAVYFFMPLGLAIVHSIIGIKVASSVVMIFGELDILANMLLTALFVLVIYGSYFIITYVASSAIVLRNR